VPLTALAEAFVGDDAGDCDTDDLDEDVPETQAPSGLSPAAGDSGIDELLS